MLRTGSRLYVHCWGGHGRTGTVVCILLHLIYNLSAFDALRRCQFVHDLRRVPIDVGSPQTPKQRAQVSRIIDRLISEAKASDRIESDIQNFTKKSDELLPAVAATGDSGGNVQVESESSSASSAQAIRNMSKNVRRFGPSVPPRNAQISLASRLATRRGKHCNVINDLEGVVAIGHSKLVSNARQQGDMMPNTAIEGTQVRRVARRPCRLGPTRQRHARNRNIIKGAKAMPAISLRIG